MDTNNPKPFVRQSNSQTQEERLTDPAGLSSPTVNPVFGSQMQLSQYLRRKIHRISRQSASTDARTAGEAVIKELQAQACLNKDIKVEVEMLTEIIQEGMNLKQERPTGLIDTLRFMSYQGRDERMKHLYEALIRAYTAETFLYRHINKVLRSEKWDGIDSMIAYLFYLVEACKEFSPKLDDTQHKQNNAIYSDLKQGVVPDLVLYRGIMLEKNQLAQYDPKTCGKFSWNGITSTSRDKRVATSFIKKKPSRDECSVVFTILYYKKADGRQFLQFSDISQQSMVTEENEVLIIPGTVFKLIETHKEGEIHHITLEVLDEEIPSSRAGSLFCLEDLQLQASQKNQQLAIGRLDKGDLEQVIDLFSKGNDFTDEVRLRACSFGPNSMARVIKSFKYFSRLQILKISCFEPAFWTPEICQALTQNLPESPKISLFLDLVEHTSSINIIHEIVSSGVYKKLNTFVVSLPTFGDIQKRFHVMKELARLPEGTLTELAIVDFSPEQDEDLVATFWALLAAIGFVHLTISNQNIQSNRNTQALCNYVAIGKIKHLYIRYRKKFDLDALKLICDTLPQGTLETFWICKCNGGARKVTPDFSDKGIEILASALEGSNLKSLGLFGIREEIESIVRLMYAIPFTIIKNIYFNVQLLQESSMGGNYVNESEKMDIINTLEETLSEIKNNLQEAIVLGSLGSENTLYERVMYSFNGQPVEKTRTSYPELDTAKENILKKSVQNKEKKGISIGYRGCEDNAFKRMRFNYWMLNSECYIVPWEEDFVYDSEFEI